MRTSLKMRQLIFRNYALNVLGTALDAVSHSSIRFDRHIFYDRVDPWRFSYGASLGTLSLVPNFLV